MRLPAAALFWAIILFAPGLAFSTTIHVPADQPTIQAGIDAASESDTVLVAPGTYTGDGNRDIDFYGKDVVVMSASGPEVTIIDCQAADGDDHRAFWFHTGESSNSKVAGFTIKNGGWFDIKGGAILMEAQSEPTISNNIFTWCRGDFGGAIYCLNSAPLITENEFTHNEAHWGGGAIYLRKSAAIISNNTFSTGEATQGGAIETHSSDALITGNLITNNSVTNDGTGIHCSQGRSEIRDNILSNNWKPEANSGGSGAAVFCWNEIAIIADNIMTGNLVGPEVLVEDDQPPRGGGIYTYAGQEVLISGNVITGNRGGGITCEYSYDLIITGNTVSGNSLLHMGSLYDGRLNSAGIEVTDNTPFSQVTISNNVCINNGAYAGGGILVAADNVTIEDCWLDDNRGAEGSGIYLKGDNISVSNCVIVNNIAVGGYGGGIAVVDCSPTFENCTIVGNRSGTAQGAALLVRNGSPVLNKCIITGHPYGELVECQATANPVFFYTDIYGNAGGNWVGCLSGQANINDNFSADPMFCDADNGNYELSGVSPCAPANSYRDLIVGAFDVGCNTYVCGDINSDGALTAADVEFYKDFYFSLPDEWEFPITAGDMDCDDRITIADIVILMGYLNGTGPDPCCVPPPKRPELPGHDSNGEL